MFSVSKRQLKCSVVGRSTMVRSSLDKYSFLFSDSFDDARHTKTNCCFSIRCLFFGQILIFDRQSKRHFQSICLDKCDAHLPPFNQANRFVMINCQERTQSVGSTSKCLTARLFVCRVLFKSLLFDDARHECHTGQTNQRMNCRRISFISDDISLSLFRSFDEEKKKENEKLSNHWKASLLSCHLQ